MTLNIWYKNEPNTEINLKTSFKKIDPKLPADLTEKMSIIVQPWHAQDHVFTSF